MFELFARPKPCSIMVALRDRETNWHLSKLASATETTYVFVTRLTSRLAEEGLVTIESQGKKRIVRLTSKGNDIANAIDELNSRFEP
jgi:predicted transcriptional regulator